MYEESKKTTRYQYTPDIKKFADSTDYSSFSSIEYLAYLDEVEAPIIQTVLTRIHTHLSNGITIIVGVSNLPNLSTVFGKQFDARFRPLAKIVDFNVETPSAIPELK